MWQLEEDKKHDKLIIKNDRLFSGDYTHTHTNKICRTIERDMILFRAGGRGGAQIYWNWDILVRVSS